jgi:hypothetical protein
MVDNVPPTYWTSTSCVFTCVYLFCLNCHIYRSVSVIDLRVYWAVRTEYSDGTDMCICELTSVSVNLPLYLWTDLCICELTSVSVNWPAYLWTDLCICELTSVSVNWPVYLWTELCIYEICSKSSISGTTHSADDYHMLTTATSCERYTCTLATCPFPTDCPSTWPKCKEATTFVSSSRQDLLMRSHKSFTFWQAHRTWAVSFSVSSGWLAGWLAKNTTQWPDATNFSAEEPSRCSMNQRQSEEPTECPNSQDSGQFRNTNAQCYVHSRVPPVPTHCQIDTSHIHCQQASKDW